MSRTHRTAMQELLRDIAAGDVPPGERLPRELDLVPRFGISRGTVRECLRALEERGVVQVRHGVPGATVNEPLEWDVFDPDVFGALLESPQAEQFEAETMECQRLLEVEAAGLAAGRAGEDDVAVLTKSVERMAEAAANAGRSRAALDRFHEAHIDFHRAVVRASGNRAIGRLSRPLHRALAAVAQPGDASGLDITVAEHRRILEAVSRGHARRARDAMAAHLSRD